MTHSAKHIVGVLLLMLVLLCSNSVQAQNPSPEELMFGVQEEPSAVRPELADIIPLAAELSARLEKLKIRVEDGLELSLLEEELAEIERNLEEPVEELQELKLSEDYRFTKLVEIGALVNQEQDLFAELASSIREEIHLFWGWREEWAAEQIRWKLWESSLLIEGRLEQLKTTFAAAHVTIETALSLILPRLELMLAVQAQGGAIMTRLHTLSTELDRLLDEERRIILFGESSPIFSAHYLSQFKKRELWYMIQKDLHDISWPDDRFFARLGWVVAIQGSLFLFATAVFYRKRKALSASPRWSFLAARPVSAGWILGVMVSALLYEYGGAPGTWKLATALFGGIAFIRLMGCLLKVSWKRQFVCALIGVLIALRLMQALSIPVPLFRLFLFFTAVLGLFFCLRWAGESARHKDSGLYPWALRVGALLFFIIILAELLGKQSLAAYLFSASIRSVVTILVFTLFMFMLRGVLEWLFNMNQSPLRRAAVLHRDDTDSIIHRLSRFINVVIWGFLLLPALLTIWEVYDSFEEAITGVFAFRIVLGLWTISVSTLILAAGIFSGAFFISWLLRTLPLDKLLIRRRVERGVRHAIERLVHYIVTAIGLLWALSILGFELTQFTIVLSALGVGIGFGLQGVVNNFFSGLILLFERPVRVGDYIDVNGEKAEIKRIGLRSTTVQTFDLADLIIPNADLISNTVTNWTLSSRRVRLSIPVGVAYGSDVALVMEQLMTCATANKQIAEIPAPQVLFLCFGENSLDFELRVWVLDVDNLLSAKSELHQEIERIFREANIEIPFPQRDLHLRSQKSPLLVHYPNADES